MGVNRNNGNKSLQGLDHQDKDLTHKDKDLKYVLKTVMLTRINITVKHSLIAEH